MPSPEGVLAVIDRARNLLPNGKAAKMPVTLDNGAMALEFEQGKAGYIDSLRELAVSTYLTIIAHTNLFRANRSPQASEIPMQALRILALGGKLLSFTSSEGSLVRMERSLASWDTWLNKTLTDKSTQAAAWEFMSEVQRTGEKELIGLVRSHGVNLAGVVLTDEGGVVDIDALDFLGIVSAFYDDGALEGNGLVDRNALSEEGLAAAFFACQGSVRGRGRIRTFISDKDSLSI